MSHQQGIEPQDAQRTKLIAEMALAQAKLLEVQWTMSTEEQKLEQILKESTVDEAAALKQLDRMLAIEQGLKRTQMTLLLRVKNILTPRQLDMLNSVRFRDYPRSP